MIEFFAAIGLFLITHLLPAIRPLRTGLISQIGRPVYFLIFSVISVGVTIWVFVAYLNAPYIQFWPFYPWERWVVVLVMPVLVMPVACLLIVVGLTSPNPFSINIGMKLFGLLTLLSALGPCTLERRRELAMGRKAWDALNNKMAAKAPLAITLTEIGWIRITAGLVLYIAVLYLHEPVIGVSPLGG